MHRFDFHAPAISKHLLINKSIQRGAGTLVCALIWMNRIDTSLCGRGVHKLMLDCKLAVSLLRHGASVLGYPGIHVSGSFTSGAWTTVCVRKDFLVQKVGTRLEYLEDSKTLLCLWRGAQTTRKGSRARSLAEGFCGEEKKRMGIP
jgi:hypothetical protein